MKRRPFARTAMRYVRAIALALTLAMSIAIVPVATASAAPSAAAAPAASAAPAAAAPAAADAKTSDCAYDVCNVALVVVDGANWVTSRWYKGRETVGAASKGWAGWGGGSLAFTLQDYDDGSVTIRDHHGWCLYAGDASGNKVIARECTGSIEERWYFQNQDYANSYAIRKVAKANGDRDDRCLDVTDGHPGVANQLQLHSCKQWSSNWQKFMPSSTVPGGDPAVRDAIQERATRYAAGQCEKAIVVKCSYAAATTSEPDLTDPVMLGRPVHNFGQGDAGMDLSVTDTKTATVNFGWSQKFTVKVEAGVAGFAKTEWTTEQAWTAGKSWTDTTSLTQTVKVTVHGNSTVWIAYAQLTRRVTGTITFTTTDTKKSWSAATTVTLPAVNSGHDASQLVICDTSSTKRFCKLTSPSPAELRSERAAADSADVPWLVVAEDEERSCSATALTESWVLTAKHCPQKTVRFGAPGSDAPTVAVDRVTDAPTGDLRLLHLSTPHPLSSYPVIDLSYVPKDGDQASVYTVGDPAAPQPLVSRATVSGAGVDGLGGGEAIRADTRSAPATRNDSGGPLVVGDRVVGVNVAWDGASTNTFASLRASASTLTAEPAVAGVSVHVRGGTLTLTMSRALIDSSNRFLVWADDRYAGETYAGTAYYLGRRDNPDGTVSLYGTVAPGALVRVGISDGRPGDFPFQSHTRVFTATLDDADISARRGDRGQVTYSLPAKIVDSQRRLVAYINGKNVGETRAGSISGLSSRKAAGTTTLTPAGTYPRGSIIEIRVAPDAPAGDAEPGPVIFRATL